MLGGGWIGGMVLGADNPMLREGIESVGERWREEGRGAGSRLIPQKIALHSGKIGGATRLAARRVPEVVIKKNDGGRRTHLSRNVRANVENPVWLSGRLEHGAGEFERQPGQETRWGGIEKVPLCPVM